MENENPPPYEESPEDDALADPILEPAIFVLTGQTIHVETVDSPPAYELSRGVASLTKSTVKVTFERFDKIIGSSTAADGRIPTVKRRRRHLYDLRRTAKMPRIGLSRGRHKYDAPEYYLHSVSRRTLGHIGLQKFSNGGFSAGFSAVPVYIAASQARWADWRPPLFRLQRKADKSEWISVNDETTVAVEDTEDNEQRLIFMRALPRREVDALVALWCCRIWQDAAVRAETARNDEEMSECWYFAFDGILLTPQGSVTRKLARGQSVYNWGY